MKSNILHPQSKCLTTQNIVDSNCSRRRYASSDLAGRRFHFDQL